LPKAIAVGDPAARHTIKEDRGFARGEEVLHPTPALREATLKQDFVQAALVHRVKRFVKIKLQNDGGHNPLVAAVKEVGSIGKPLRDAASPDEPRLVTTDKGRDNGLKAARKNHGDCFDNTILESNGAKVSSMPSHILLGDEDNEGEVDAVKISIVGIKSIKDPNDGGGDNGPGRLVKGATEAVRPRAGRGVHLLEGRVNLRGTEGNIKEVEWATRPIIDGVQIK